MKNDYVSVVYDEKRTPKTDYPYRLAGYLLKRYSIANDAVFLELGCGRGDFLEAFASLGLRCCGVDISDHCASKTGVIDFKCADISKDRLPFDDNAFDVVYHKSVLEHFNDPSHLMAETKRVLKPGGRVIMLTPDWVSQMKVFYEDFTHARPYDKNSLSDLLAVYDFSGIRTERFYQLPLLWRYPSLKLLSGALRAVLSTPHARRLTELTRIKFFRWSVELMVLGSGINEKR